MNFLFLQKPHLPHSDGITPGQERRKSHIGPPRETHATKLHHPLHVGQRSSNPRRTRQPRFQLPTSRGEYTISYSTSNSTFPLPQMKNSPWEGAMKGVAAVWSPLIKKPQRVSNQLMHISDWLPTFFSAAGK